MTPVHDVLHILLFLKCLWVPFLGNFFFHNQGPPLVPLFNWVPFQCGHSACSQSSKDTTQPIICLQITIHTCCPPRSPMLFHHLTAKCVETNEIVISGRYSNSVFRDNLVERPIFISMTYLQVTLLYWFCPLQSVETSYM